MTQIALFHSVLGVRPGILDAADRLRAAGHEVLVVDQYDGLVFDDYAEAGAFVARIGFPPLLDAPVAGAPDLAHGFVARRLLPGGGQGGTVATHPGGRGEGVISAALAPAGLWGGGAD